ncbi:MAG TPA: M56 family metallopeptidase [Planctomycetaceae bacterium]|nr:M56 family metallopeptidase [Planctomycetaceae bacterium]
MSTTARSIKASSPYLCLAYLVGVTWMLGRFGLSLVGGARLQRTLEPISDANLLAMISAQAIKLGLRRIPLVAVCQRICVPAVVGIFQPVILLPPALLSGLDPQQLAAILSHELAHIRRYDLIVNLLQRVVEALLFFHPVTWWISRRVRVERENCCDDYAADSTGRLEYAGALLQMAELCIGRDRGRLSALATLSADGGSASDFAMRVRRLIDTDYSYRLSISRRGLAGAAAMASLLFISVLALGQAQVQNYQNPAVTAETVTEDDFNGTRPNTKIAGRVVDSDGRPIADASISCSAFHGDKANAFEPIDVKTDRDGHFDANVPCRVFQVYIGSPNEIYDGIPGFIVRDGKPVCRCEGVQDRSSKDNISVVATLPHSYGLNIELVDDVSGQPIKDGAVLYKEGESTWAGDGESAYETDASWEIFHTVEGGETRQQVIVSRAHGLAHLIVIATGYEPVKTKLIEKLERGKPMTQTIRMKPVAPIQLTIVQPDGTPASEATFESRDMKDFRHILRHDTNGVLRRLLAVELKADEGGVATFPRPAFGEWASYRIEHTSGHLDINIRDIPVSADRVSVSKHRVELLGRVTIQGRYLPMVGDNEFLEVLRLQPSRFAIDGSPQRVELDQDGRFSLPSQLAGWHSFVHRVETTDKKGNRGISAIASFGPFEMHPGEKRTLTLGDDCASVIGKLVLPKNERDDFRGLTIQAYGGGSFIYPHEPRGLDEQASLDWWNAYWASPAGRDHDEYGLRNRTIPVASDGSICFPMLTPGSYKLRASRADQVVSLSKSELVIGDDQRGTVIDLGDLMVEIEEFSYDPEHGENHDHDHTKKTASWIPACPLKTTVSAGSARILDDHSVGFEGDVTWQEATTHFAFNDSTTLDEFRLELLPVDSPAGPNLDAVARS